VTAFLASVGNLPEARLALAGGADVIDLKDAGNGALGALPVATLRQVAAAVRGRAMLSATLGDPPIPPRQVAAAARTAAAAGIDLVKVGMYADTMDAELPMVLRKLRAEGIAVVAVWLLEGGVPLARVATLAAAGVHGILLDTADKRAGPLPMRLPMQRLHAFVGAVQAAGLHAGLAGSLRTTDVPALLALRPDYLGFRGALCNGGRDGMLEPTRVAALRALIPAAEAYPPTEATPHGTMAQQG